MGTGIAERAVVHAGDGVNPKAVPVQKVLGERRARGRKVSSVNRAALFHERKIGGQDDVRMDCGGDWREQQNGSGEKSTWFHVGGGWMD